VQVRRRWSLGRRSRGSNQRSEGKFRAKFEKKEKIILG
jgi:hypothetical protein